MSDDERYVAVCESCPWREEYDTDAEATQAMKRHRKETRQEGDRHHTTVEAHLP